MRPGTRLVDIETRNAPGYEASRRRDKVCQGTGCEIKSGREVWVRG